MTNDPLPPAIDWAAHPPADALDRLGILIDSSFDQGNAAALRQALRASEALATRQLSTEQALLLDYFTANAWANIRVLSRSGSEDVWDWEQEEFEKEVLHLRRALASSAFGGLPKVRQCQVLTNLANALNQVGRFVEAMEYWDRALEVDSAFGMAHGNRGCGLTTYAHSLYDDGHQLLFLKYARRSLKAAIDSPIHEEARPTFQKAIGAIEAIVSKDALSSEDPRIAPNPKKTDQEIAYRKWCLANRLFLNPLNDLGTDGLAERDVLTTPSIVTGIDEGPYYPGFYNQMKQEFVSARYFLFEGTTADAPHFSDRDVLLYNTLDYPAYSLAVERTKAAFRAAYSVLDKIAFFLNHYLGFQIPERQVNFRTFWYEAQDRRRGLRSFLRCRANLPLRGLFWVSKDMYEDQQDFRDAMQPDARNLAEIRNHLEHKYLKVHDEMWSGPLDPQDKVSRALADTLAHSLRRAELEAKTLRLVKVTRAALSYLSLAVHVEERHRAKDRPKDKLVLPMPLDVIEDDWKR